MCVFQNPQVVAFERRSQETGGGAPADAIALIYLKKSRPFIVAVVEIRARHNSKFLGSLLNSIQDVPVQPLPGDFPFAIPTVHFRCARVMIL